MKDFPTTEEIKKAIQIEYPTKEQLEAALLMFMELTIATTISLEYADGESGKDISKMLKDLGRVVEILERYEGVNNPLRQG